MISGFGGLRLLHAGAAASMFMLVACWTSPKPEQEALADQQRGAAVTLRMTDGVAHSGELLSVRDTSIMLLLGQRVAVAPLSGVASIAFGQYGSPTPAGKEGLLDQARTAARFPYGIPPAALTVLLRQAGQDAPVVLRPGTP
jgi:hypothetical protein